MTLTKKLCHGSVRARELLRSRQLQPFGLCFDDGTEGIAAWARYIQACRKGETEVAGVGRPSVVRAWIATEEIEMVCAGFISADELAGALDTSELIVQYCIADQDLMDRRLVFVQSFEVR